MLEQSDYIICPNCGTKVPIVKRLKVGGRKPLNISVKNICGTLRACRDITLTAEKLGCSRGYIYMVLAQQGMTPREVIQKR